MAHPVLARLDLADVNSGAGFGQWIAEPGGVELTSVNPADGKPLLAG